MLSTGERKCIRTFGILRHASAVYKSPSGTLGIPISYPFAVLRKPSQNT